MEKIVFTVSQINNQINSILNNSLKSIFVKGEISSFKIYPSGHAYFTLKDKNSEIPCVFFNYTNLNENKIIYDKSTVTVHADPGMYVAKGKLQLYIKKIYQIGDGELWLEYMRLKNKLDKEGLFSAKYKKKIPFLSSKIGLITSSKGSVIQDIINILNRRAPYLDLILADIPVQGEKAPKLIIDAIDYLSNIKKPDLIIIARGGGSIEDLMPFNNEKVVRKIFESKIPIISAIGHETDFTLCDFVSDLRASTPSEAAEICSADIRTISNNIDEINQRLYFESLNFIKMKKFELNDYYYKTISKNPKLFLSSIDNEISYKYDRFKTFILDKINFYKNKISFNDKLIENLNVAAIKKRGFAIVKKDGKFLKSRNKLNKNDIILIDMKDGSFNSQVLSKNK